MHPKTSAQALKVEKMAGKIANVPVIFVSLTNMD
jgi:hypothetical protein